MLRWLFFITWVLILFALLGGLWSMIRMNLKLDRDHNERGLLKDLLEQITRDVKAQDKPPTSMGMDFGIVNFLERRRRPR